MSPCWAPMERGVRIIDPAPARGKPPGAGFRSDPEEAGSGARDRCGYGVQVMCSYEF
jgi:hypothetical protein